jgi:RNA recognition motif-containing protein
VTITKLKYPVNADVLFAVFNKYGEVLRIIIFDKDRSQQALIEMGDTAQATKAKDAVNGQHIYSASNLMTMQFSTRNKLSVSGQSAKARDFTRPDEKAEPQEAQNKRPRLVQAAGTQDAKMTHEKDSAGLLGRQEFAELFMRSFEQTGAGEAFDRAAIESQLQSWQQSSHGQLGNGGDQSSIFSSKHMADENSS